MMTNTDVVVLSAQDAYRLSNSQVADLAVGPTLGFHDALEWANVNIMKAVANCEQQVITYDKLNDEVAEYLRLHGYGVEFYPVIGGRTGTKITF